MEIIRAEFPPKKKMLYFSLLPTDLNKYFHKEYLAKELDIVWVKIYPWLSRGMERIFSSPILNSKYKSNYMFYAASNGYISMLDYGERYRYPHEHLGCYAAKGGHLKALQWVYYKGITGWSENIPSIASYEGHLEILEWIHTIHGMNWNEACTFAAKGGKKDILVWLKENGYEFSLNTIHNALVAKQTKIIPWLIENGCPWNKETVIAVWNEYGGDPEILPWLESREGTFD